MTGVRFKVIPNDVVDSALPIMILAPAGVRILGALDVAARALGRDLTVTCADRGHAAADPHTSGEAFDVRTHDLPSAADRSLLLRSVLLQLADPGETPAPVSTVALENLATARFFGQIENPGQPNEHLHVQRRNGTTYA